ncbi:MAG: integrase core domain-containing protein [Nocardioides sp.]
MVQKNSRPNHPTTCGKVERFQQTMKNWLTAQPVQPTTIAELQTLLDQFVEAYNHQRPHRELGRNTPANTYTYTSLPKAEPIGDHRPGHYRLRHDRLDKDGKMSFRRAGRMHHIGVGSEPTPATASPQTIVDGLHIRHRQRRHRRDSSENSP